MTVRSHGRHGFEIRKAKKPKPKGLCHSVLLLRYIAQTELVCAHCGSSRSSGLMHMSSQVSRTYRYISSL